MPQGKQLAPIFTEGANIVRVQFTDDVLLTGNEMKLLRTPARYSDLADGLRVVQTVTGGFSYDQDTHIATWEFEPYDWSINYYTSPGTSLFPKTLFPDRYQIFIEVESVKSGDGSTLDGDWNNQYGSTLYDWTDDPVDSNHKLLSGNGTSGTDFRFLFAYLPGDYNQNGIVDGGDEVVLADTNGLSDGDGDGVSDKINIGLSNGDYVVWFHYLGYGLFGTSTGDYNHDGQTTFEDYTIWRATYGSSTDLRADGNGSSVIDTADYTVWRTWWDNNCGSTSSAWDLSGSGSAAGLIFNDSATAPKVTNVTISGSNSTHNPYTFASHVGSGDQLSTVPVGGADTVSITFSEEVNVVATDLRLVGLRTYNVPELLEFTYDGVTMTATWRFDDLIANDQYLISLSDMVTDTQGYHLDGEWVNPATTTTTNSLVSEFPSGDGHSGGNFNFVFTLLAGDADLNNKVNGHDYGIWEEYLYVGDQFILGDFSGDGVIDEIDESMLIDNLNIWLQSLSMSGDLTGDFIVDDADAAIMLANFGMSGATHADGDLNGDGSVTLADLDVFFTQYGMRLALVS